MDEYELAPLDEPPRRNAAPMPASPAGALPPVPFDPPHLCPSCEYNLGGLTHRTCPECGNEFDLREARSAATGGAGPYDGADLRVLRMARAKLIVGIVLIVVGVLTPAWLSGFHRFAIFSIINVIALPFVLIVISSVATDWDWSTVVLLWGLAAFTMGATSVALAML